MSRNGDPDLAARLGTGLSEWLVSRMRHCAMATQAPEGPAGDVWGKPDLIGFQIARGEAGGESRIETTAVKIAWTAADLPAALGVACSFLLCCHRVYLAIPEDLETADGGRCAELCRKYGIGIVAFLGCEPDLPLYGVRVKAEAQTPDPVWANYWLSLMRRVPDAAGAAAWPQFTPRPPVMAATIPSLLCPDPDSLAGVGAVGIG